MSEFVQIHALVNYPPGNPNRDDLGRPKTVVIGGTQRQRISSQCLKRTWRQSAAFAELAQGVRTKDVVGSVQQHLEAGGIQSEIAVKLATKVGAAVGSQPVKGEKDKGAVLTFLTVHEINGIKQIVETLTQNPEAEIDEALAQLPSRTAAGQPRGVGPDVALFGRMVAKDPILGIDAALQVAHAFTVHKAGLEVDYWTGVSDEDPWFDAAKSISDAGAGAGMIDTLTFGGGIFYLYACINRTQLVGNLGGDEEAATKAIKALVEALATSSPSGKKTQFATNTRAEFLLIEQGTNQPRSLASAFHEPSKPEDNIRGAAKKLRDHKQALDSGYGDVWHESTFLAGVEGSLSDVLESL